MARRRPALTLTYLLSFAALAALASPAQAAAKNTFVFELTKVQLKVKGATPPDLEGIIRKSLGRKIDAAERLLAAPPKDAPDPKADPKAFVAYMKKHRMSAYKVNVEVKEYESEVEDAGEGRGKLITVRVALRMFGETNPDRSMAFTGEGSATIKLSVGSKVRDRDLSVANNDAIELAIDDALAMSIEKLDAPKKGKRKNKR